MKPKDIININGLEINISEQCNLRCKGCDHGMDVITPQNIPLPNLLQDVQKASQYFHTKTLRIIGGEPLLHPELSQIIQDFQNTHIADSIELWTNGLLLDNISKTNWELLNGIVISKYPNTSNTWDNKYLKAIAEKYNVWIHVRDSNTFSWSMYLKKNTMDTARILHNSCRESATCNTIRKGKFYKCVQSAFAIDRLLYYGIKLDDDGIELHNSNNFIEKIENHIWSNNPLNACYYCLGEFGAKFPHEQNTNEKYNIEEINFDNHFISP
ncbi:MAG: radical SAM protein [Planctomycetia bacterium]|nr:radical SAM protein [Planctomycetia bacterium]